MTGLRTKAMIQALQETEEGDAATYKQTFKELYSEAINQLPWDIVQDQVESQKGSMEIISENLFLGIIESRIEPIVVKTGSISRDIAAQLINMKYAIQYALPLKNEVVEVLQAYIDANKVEKPDIWKERSVEFSQKDNLEPVLIGIWDTGVDTDVFEGRLYINEGEKINNKDDDNNGFIDDVYGIAYTLHEDKTPHLMYPLDPTDAKRLPDMMDQIKGLEDLQAAIESPEASELKKKMSSLKPDEVKPFIEEINLFSIYAHGTHVAGIAVEGNPYAKILVARITADHRMIPEPPTIELAKKARISYKEVVNYFQKNNVRTVNMSLGLTVKEIELTLEANGIGKDAEERSKLTREIFDIYRDGLYNALKSASDILFVIAAGNIDSDVEFDEVIPSSFDLPNVLTVGAVDQAGEETSFTSFGESVDVHANGFEVESYVPGGSRMAFSGTSMSAPNVVNLAGKLFALDPSLTVSEVIDLIKKGAEISKNGRLVLINPKKSVEILKDEKN